MSIDRFVPAVTSKWGVLMNTMEALGPGLNLSAKGETTGLNLIADAETLALFASLFAMMQTPQQDGATAGAIYQTQPQSEGTKPPLPAAAALMAGLVPISPGGDREAPLANILADEPQTSEGEQSDTAGLLKLLLAAHDIATPDHVSMSPSAAAKDTAATAPTRTATEMLTGAIDILKSLEMGAAESPPTRSLGPDG